ncbi:MAG: hypothetical protein KDD10_10780 [Phaeodactylibacter sp.]|nr:hypothetical protein [Phaeodactylibacter sp.]MCB9297692.1 hypothetical protein [Lewinellaceae bacterium]
MQREAPSWRTIKKEKEIVFFVVLARALHLGNRFGQKKSPASGAFEVYLAVSRTKLFSPLWLAIKVKAEKVKIVQLNFHLVRI